MKLPGHFLDPPAPRNEHEARVAALMMLALWLLALLFLWRGAHSAGGEEDKGA
jgi:hypothetical protein